MVCGDFKDSQSSLVCRLRVVVCKDFAFFLKSPLCVAPLLWCVLTLRFFKEPLCGPVLWCMWTKIKDSENLKINTVDDA